jgi:transposase-like protein
VEAAQIYEGVSAVEAGERLSEWVLKRSSSEPKAVELFELDFEQTLGYYQLEGVARELARTTSLLERVNRELRGKLRQVDSFGSEVGAEVGSYLQIRRLNAKWSGENWWEVSQQICFERLELNP